MLKVRTRWSLESRKMYLSNEYSEIYTEYIVILCDINNFPVTIYSCEGIISNTYEQITCLFCAQRDTLIDFNFSIITYTSGIFQK